ncbi:MAG: rod shape-determining protein MreC, partial [Nocardioides sp.]
LGDAGALDLELVDQSEVPAKHDTVVTWGSEGGAPYVSGVPVGRVSAVFSSVRETSQRAVIEPFVDFGALDLVGIVVPSGSITDGPIIEADGTLR